MALNEMSEGQLLRQHSQSGVVRKWWVSEAVLSDMLDCERAKRHGVSNVRGELDRAASEVETIHHRLDELEKLSEAIIIRLRKQWAEINSLK